MGRLKWAWLLNLRLGLPSKKENWRIRGEDICYESVEKGKPVAFCFNWTLSIVMTQRQAAIVRSKKDTTHTKAERHILEAIKVMHTHTHTQPHISYVSTFS